MNIRETLLRAVLVFCKSLRRDCDILLQVILANDLTEARIPRAQARSITMDTNVSSKRSFLVSILRNSTIQCWISTSKNESET